MPIYSSLSEPLRLLFSVFQLDELHGPVHDNKGGILLEGREQILFYSLLVLSPDDMRLPPKNRLSGFIVVVFQVLFLLYVVKSYRRSFNFFSKCLNHGFQTFATITANLMFMGTTSLKLGVLRIT